MGLLPGKMLHVLPTGHLERDSGLVFRSSVATAAGLLHHHVDLVAVVHLQRLRRVVVLDSLAIEDEPALIVGETLSLAVGFHQLLELRALFDFKEDLCPVLSFDLDVELLASGGSACGLAVGSSCGVGSWCS